MKDKKLREWLGLEYLENNMMRRPRSSLEVIGELEKRIDMVELLLSAVVKHLKLEPVKWLNGGEIKIDFKTDEES